VDRRLERVPFEGSGIELVTNAPSPLRWLPLMRFTALQSIVCVRPVGLLVPHATPFRCFHREGQAPNTVHRSFRHGFILS